jgi:NhaC family Na+:H+ antiporter
MGMLLLELLLHVAGVAVPSAVHKTGFAQRGPTPIVLARTITASARPTSALMQWNSCGAFVAATLGLATLKYLPYAVFDFASPLIVIAMACSGIRMIRRDA